MNNSAAGAPPLTAGPPTIRLPERAFMAFFPAFIGLAFIPCCCRIAFRLYYSRRLFLDDYFVIFAAVCLAPAAGLVYSVRQQMYLQVWAGVGWTDASVNYVEEMLEFEKRIMAASALAWASLYAIKFAFLIFFRQLVSRVEKLVYFWWLVAAFTGLCGLTSIPLSFIVCPHLTEDYLSACPKDMQLTNERTYLITSTVFDVFTDILIMIVPLLLLFPLQLAFRRKLAVAGMMCLSLIMIIIAIVRIVGAPLQSGIIDTSWLVFWQGMESAIAVLMVSLLVLKSMFRSENVRRSERQRRLDIEKGQRSPGQSANQSSQESSTKSYIRSLEPAHNVETSVINSWTPSQTYAHPQSYYDARNRASHEQRGRSAALRPVYQEIGATERPEFSAAKAPEVRTAAVSDNLPPRISGRISRVLDFDDTPFHFDCSVSEHSVAGPDHSRMPGYQIERNAYRQ